MLFKLFKTSDFIEYEEIFESGNSFPENFNSHKKIEYFGTLNKLIFNDIESYTKEFYSLSIEESDYMLSCMNNSNILSTLEDSVCVPSKIHYPNFSKDLKARLNLVDDFFSRYLDSYVSGLKSEYAMTGHTIKDYFEPRFLNRAYVIHFFKEETDETPLCIVTLNMSFETNHFYVKSPELLEKIGKLFKSHGLEESLFEEGVYKENYFNTDLNFYSESGSIIYPSLYHPETSFFDNYKNNYLKRENEYRLSLADFDEVSKVLFFLCSDREAYYLLNGFDSFSLFNIYKDEKSLRKQELYGYFEGMLPICPIE